MNRQWVLAALVAATAFVFAGAAEAATTASSPPAPRRATVSPRRSAAGASATATHAARSHHGRKRHRAHRTPTEEIVSSTAGATGGGSPPQPARRNSATNHHADLRPLPHSARPSIRVRSGWQGSAAEASAGAAYHAAMKRVCVWSMATPLSNEDRLILGRGPPRGSPGANACSSSQHPCIPDIVSALLRSTTESPRSKNVPIRHGTGFTAVPTPAAWEGAVACLDSPSVGDCT